MWPFSKFLKKKNKEEFGSEDELEFGLGASDLEDEFLPYIQAPKGIPVLKPSVLIANYQEKIKTLRLILGLSHEVYGEFVIPVLHRYIAYADLLPASQYKHHSSSGGLIEHAFQCAFLAARKVQLVEFPRDGSALRSDIQRSKSQWQVATVISSFLHDAGKVTADVRVHNGFEADDEKYIECSLDRFKTINDWAKHNKIERYFVSWHDNRYGKHLSRNSASMNYLVPRKTQTWLKDCTDGRNIYSAMELAVSGLGQEHPLSKIVISSDVESIRHDMITSRRGITKEFTRIKISDLIANLVKHYYFKGDLKINTNGAWLWYVDQKLFLAWENLVPFILEELESVNYRIPTVPDFLASLMVEEGLCERFARSRIYEKISPVILGTEKSPKFILALRVRVVEDFIGDPSKLYSLSQFVKDEISEAEILLDAAVTLRDQTGVVEDKEPSIATLRRAFSYAKEKKSNVNANPVIPEPKKKSSNTSPAKAEPESAQRNPAATMAPKKAQSNGATGSSVKKQGKPKKVTVNSSRPTLAPKVASQTMSDEDICLYLIEKLKFPLKNGVLIFEDGEALKSFSIKLKKSKINGNFYFDKMSVKEISEKLVKLSGYKYTM